MRHLILSTLLLIISLITSINIKAQPLGNPNLNWGQPSQLELEMTNYEPAPDADAVVLCKTTDMKYVIDRDGIKIQYDVKGRIKILKPEGTDHASVEINYTVNDDKPGNREAVSYVKGATFNLVNGNLVKREINTNMITTRLASDPKKRVMTVFFPDVKAGSVIEYEYSILSDLYLEVKDWEAQCEIPVAYTRYELSIPEWFSFYMQTLGREYNTSRIVQRQMTERPTYTILTSAQTFTCLGVNFEYIGLNLSPIKNEKLVFNPYDSGQRVIIDITGIALPNQSKKDFSMTWEDIDKSLLDYEQFGKRFKSNPLKKEMKQAGIYQMSSIDEKITATIKLLRQIVKWDGTYSLYGSPTKQVIKSGTGSNTDINFLLISMLNDAGIKAYPAILATRERDYVDTKYPSVKQFSTTVVVIDNGSKYQYFDGSVENALIDILPANFLVNNARIIGKEISNPWVNLEDKGLMKTSYKLTGTLSQDGTLTATCVITHQDKAAEQMRGALKIQNNESPNTKFQSPEFHITDYSVEGLDNLEQPVVETIKFSYNIKSENGTINVPQLLWPLIEPELFESEIRYNPIEFPTKVDETADISITIPDGWVVNDIPAPISLNTSDNKMLLAITPSSTGNTINVSTQLLINRLNFNKQDYISIKNLVDRINKQSKEPFILKRQ